MNRSPLDEALKTEFEALRQHDAAHAPPMAQVLARGRSRTTPSLRLVNLRRLALAAVVVIGLSIALWPTGEPESSLSTWQSPTDTLLPTPLPEPPLYTDDVPIATVSAWESPTDFLMPSSTPLSF